MFTECCRSGPGKQGMRWRLGCRKLLGSAVLINTPGAWEGRRVGQRETLGCTTSKASADLFAMSKAWMAFWSGLSYNMASRPLYPSVPQSLDESCPGNVYALEWGHSSTDGNSQRGLTAEGSQPATLSAAGGINPLRLEHSRACITLTIFINLWIACS